MRVSIFCLVLALGCGSGDEGKPGAGGENGTPGADGEDGTPGAGGEDGTPGADGEDGTPGADGDDGTPGADGDDGTPGADGEDGTPGAGGDCSGVETLTFVDDGVTWPAGTTAGIPTAFTAHLNDTGMEVSLAFYGLDTFTYTGGNEFTATLSESDSFIVMATDSCSMAIHTVVLTIDVVAEPGSTSFIYTGGEQSFTVPAGVSSINVEALGGAGGNTSDGIVGGLGGYLQATLDVTPGEILNVFVGQMGPTSSGLVDLTAGGYNGGGSVHKASPDAGGGTGGGATDIRSYPYGLEDRLIVAGAGGGGGWDTYEAEGGAGGGFSGGDGYSNSSTYLAGAGGTQTEGGVGAWLSDDYPNEDGTFGLGGGCWHDGASCGAGGGGWYGGGGGAFAGGGGGSSYTIPEATGVEHEQGVHSGNGELYISW